MPVMDAVTVLERPYWRFWSWLAWYVAGVILALLSGIMASFLVAAAIVDSVIPAAVVVYVFFMSAMLYFIAGGVAVTLWEEAKDPHYRWFQ